MTLAPQVPLLSLHVLLTACGPFGAVPSAVCGFFGDASSTLSQAVEILQNPFRWLYHHTLGAPVPQHPGDPGWAACEADWAQTACPKLIDELQPSTLTLSQAWPRLYATFAVSGVVIAMTCCVARVVRAVFDERVTGMHMVGDAVTRAVVATALLVAPTPGNSLLLNIMRLAATSSGIVALAAAHAVASVFADRLDLGAVVGNVAATAFGLAGIGDFLVAIPVLLAAAAFVYILALYLLRVVQLVFAVATAPLFVAVGVYDPRSRFVHWWLDLFTSAMLLPLILGVCGALTAGVALFFLDGNSGGVTVGGATEGVVRTLLACFSVLGGVWMTGKAVHGLAWRGFVHGGITGAATALSTSIMALPSAAGDVAGMVRGGGTGAAGRFRGGGVGARAQGAALPDGGGQVGVAVGSAAAGHAAAMAGESDEVDAGMSAAAVADFSRRGAVGAVLPDPDMRAAFNRAVGGAIGRFAASGPGRAAVVSATAHLAGQPMAERVAAYTAAVADDPQLAGAVAGSSLASLLHDRTPDLEAILRERGGAPV